MTKIAGSGSISQRHGSADSYPHQNVMDPQHLIISVWCAGSPEEEEAGGAGLVSSFFASLKSAIYGEQRKQDRSSR
jgi:hypothetical protein